VVHQTDEREKQSEEEMGEACTRRTGTVGILNSVSREALDNEQFGRIRTFYSKNYAKSYEAYISQFLYWELGHIFS
jgi:hypothetical protein